MCVCVFPDPTASSIDSHVIVATAAASAVVAASVTVVDDVVAVVVDVAVPAMGPCRSAG